MFGSWSSCSGTAAARGARGGERRPAAVWGGAGGVPECENRGEPQGGRGGAPRAPTALVLAPSS